MTTSPPEAEMSKVKNNNNTDRKKDTGDSMVMNLHAMEEVISKL
jgi:hypothetical protein